MSKKIIISILIFMLVLCCVVSVVGGSLLVYEFFPSSPKNVTATKEFLELRSTIQWGEYSYDYKYVDLFQDYYFTVRVEVPIKEFESWLQQNDLTTDVEKEESYDNVTDGEYVYRQEDLNREDELIVEITNSGLSFSNLISLKMLVEETDGELPEKPFDLLVGYISKPLGKNYEVYIHYLKI